MTEIKTDKGTMTFIQNKNTTLDKELVALKGLEELIDQDKKNNDEKSLKYHTLALEETKKKIEELKQNKDK